MKIKVRTTESGRAEITAEEGDNSIITGLLDYNEKQKLADHLREIIEELEA